MLTEMVEYGRKMEEKVKAIQSDIKRNTQGINSEGKEIGKQINDLELKEEINIQPEENEETRIQKKKVRRGLGISGKTLNIPTSESQGCQKEKRNRKKMKTYFKK